MPAFGSVMPDYPRPGARGVKPLISRSESSPKTGDLLAGDPQALMDTLAVVLTSGGGLLFSTTQDGGALSVTLYVGDERYRSYAKDRDELTALLDSVRDVAEAFMLSSRAKTLQTPQKPRSGR